MSRTALCPLCRRPIDPALLLIQPKLEDHIARILSENNHGWKLEDGACLECIHGAVEKAIEARSPTSLQAEQLTPFPVYSRDEKQLLLTPVRVQANPNFTGRGVTVAFLDSGFYPHPDLVRPKNRILCYVDATGRVPIEKQNFKKPIATSWHGLMTSTICAGNGFMSGHLYRGLAEKAKLVLVKTGNLRGRGIHDRDLTRALTWVLKNHERFNIRIVNISLGGDNPTTGKFTELDELVEEAVSRGIVIVAAAGNTGRRIIVPPASAPSAITVGGLNDQNHLDPRYRRLYWSSYGRGINGVRKPDVIAPAMWLAAPMLPKTRTHNTALYLWRLAHASDTELSKLLGSKHAQIRFSKKTLDLPLPEIRYDIQEQMNGQKFIHPHYQHVDGTSMSAPIVSGIAAQMLEANPSLKPTQVKEILMMTADPLNDAPAERQGAGTVNAGRAVAAALRVSGGLLQGIPISPHIAPHETTFYYYDPAARKVAVVGSFNGWQTEDGEMIQIRPGLWEGVLDVPARGTHRYKFLIDRSRWINDSENSLRIEDGFGGFNSLITIER
ncbi:MAG: S8 family serine peptidase [Anaerolineae bacterium]|nr:S8 family serine peptidase [Anaerolineae bacterium]